jgi:hypothetical protein
VPVVEVVDETVVCVEDTRKEDNITFLPIQSDHTIRKKVLF